MAIILWWLTGSGWQLGAGAVMRGWLAGSGIEASLVQLCVMAWSWSRQ